MKKQDIKLYACRLEICKNKSKPRETFLAGNAQNKPWLDDLSSLLHFWMLYFYNGKKISKNAFSSYITFNISFYCILIQHQMLVSIKSQTWWHRLIRFQLSIYCTSYMVRRQNCVQCVFWWIKTLLLEQNSKLPPELNCSCLLFQDCLLINKMGMTNILLIFQN